VLSAANRIRNGKDFARTTSSGVRATSPSLVLYLLTPSDCLTGPQLGLIVNKSVGGSVVRHRISRQLRHLFAKELNTFPANSQIVIRVLKGASEYGVDFVNVVTNIQKKLMATMKATV
jgi:ribonuclease P protein component